VNLARLSGARRCSGTIIIGIEHGIVSKIRHMVAGRTHPGLGVQFIRYRKKFPLWGRPLLLPIRSGRSISSNVFDRSAAVAQNCSLEILFNSILLALKLSSRKA
jgi:hypothetical protein